MKNINFLYHQIYLSCEDVICISCKGFGASLMWSSHSLIIDDSVPTKVIGHGVTGMTASPGPILGKIKVNSFKPMHKSGFP